MNQQFVTDCDLDIDWCGWSNVGSRDTFDWITNQGPTRSEGTGPEVDHTTRSSRGKLFCH